MFIAVLFTIAMTWKQHKCLSIDKWVKKISICLYIYIYTYYIYIFFPESASDQELACQCKRHKRWDLIPGTLAWEDPLEEGMTIHSSILAWRIPWIEETGELSSIESYWNITQSLKRMK